MKKGTSTLYSLFFLLLLIGLPQAAWAGPTISWNRQSIARIMSPGFSGTETVTFESDTALSDVDLVVVPALQAYLSVSPAHFSVVKAQTPYSVTLSLQIPADAQLNTWVDGTMHLAQGRRTLATPLQISLGIEVDAVRQSDPDKIVTDGQFRYPSNEVLLILSPGTGLADAQQIASSFGGTVVGFIPSLNVYQVLTQTNTVGGLDDLIQSLKASGPPFLMGVTMNCILSLAQTPSANTDLENLASTAGGKDWVFAYSSVKTQKAWDFLRWKKISGQRDVVVGLIDSGVDVSHPEFASVSFGNTPPDAKKDAGGCGWSIVPYYSPFCGHGTEVAGIIGANNQSDPYASNYQPGQMNGILSGIPGYFKNGQTRYTLEERNWAVLPHALEKGYELETTIAEIGFIDSLINSPSPASVILLEFSGPLPRECVIMFFNEMSQYQDRALFVMPAGNRDTWVSKVTAEEITQNPNSFICAEAPGCISLPNTITVGAFDPSHDPSATKDRLGDNYGPAVDVSGPGAYIYAPEPLVNDPPPTGDNNQPYNNSFGQTSGAAPFVAGTAALIWAVKPQFPSPQELKSLIKDSAYPLPTSLEIGKQLDICKAVKAALNLHDPSAPQLLSPTNNAVIPLDTSTSSGAAYNVYFNWSDVSCTTITGYDLELSLNNQVYWGTTTTPTTLDFNFLISNPPSLTGWTWKVTAVDQFGNKASSATGAFSFQSPVVGAPDVAIGMTANPTPVVSGSALIYSITVQNVGSAAAEGVVVTDALDSRVTFQSCSVSCSRSGGVVTVNLGTLAAGASITFTITVNAPEVGTSTDLTSVATVSTTGTEPNTGNNQVSLTTTVQPGQAVPLTVLYSFTGGSDGVNPYGEVIRDEAGNIYGSTALGGANNLGTVYELTSSSSSPTGYAEQVLHSFKGGTGDGSNPLGGLVRDSATGNLFGITELGGSSNCISGCGTVFELVFNPSTNNYTEQVLYSFKFGTGDGSIPFAGLVRDSTTGNLFGTTTYGGASTNCVYGSCGTVFELVFNPSTNSYTEQVLYSFKGGTGDGTNPLGGLVRDSATGNLLGTTEIGGSSTNCGANGCGTVFELVFNPGTNSYSEQVLYSFTGGTSDGAGPEAGIVKDSDGNLFGTTSFGGSSGLGTVFELLFNPGTNSYSEQVLYNFTGGISDGANPEAGLVRDSDGNLFGTTISGGSSGSCFGCGTVFELTPPAAAEGSWIETVLHIFGESGDGVAPRKGLLRDPAGNLFGTTFMGGSSTNCDVNGCGTVFKLQIPQ